MATTQLQDKLRQALATKFPSDKADEIMYFFNSLMKKARLNQWGESITEGVKFAEAVLKCLHYLRTDLEVDIVDVDEEIKLLEHATGLGDFERSLIPDALSLMYKIGDKRGGAHNFSFYPIEPDCVLVVANSKWVMEELARLCLTNDALAAKMLIEGLLVREVSLVEEISGDRLVLVPGLSARIQLEIILCREHPKRYSVKDLARWVHNQSVENIRMTLRTMKQKNLAHETEEGWTLTRNGVYEAEAEMNRIQSNTVNINTTGKKSSAKGAKRGRK